MGRTLAATGGNGADFSESVGELTDAGMVGIVLHDCPHAGRQIVILFGELCTAHGTLCRRDRQTRSNISCAVVVVFS